MNINVIDTTHKNELSRGMLFTKNGSDDIYILKAFNASLCSLAKFDLDDIDTMLSSELNVTRCDLENNWSIFGYFGSFDTVLGELSNNIVNGLQEVGPIDMEAF